MRFQPTVITRYFSRLKSEGFPWILALLTVGYVAYYWGSPAIIQDDSDSYLDFSAIRTAGYPVFIDLITASFGSVDAVANAQVVIAGGAFAYLGWSIHRAFGTSLFALAPVLALMLHPQVAEVHGFIMTESLFVSLLCLLTACLVLLVHRPTWYWTAATALACGLAITVRPAGLSLLIVWPFLFWLIWRHGNERWITLITAVAVPIVLCIIVENVIWHANHDSEHRPNLADRHLFAKVLIIESETEVSDFHLVGVVAEGRRLTAPARDLIAEAPSHYARARLLADFEVRAQWWNDLDQEISAIAKQRGIDQYGVYAQLGRPTMLKLPLSWIENTLTHYLGLWSRAYVTTSIYREYLTYIENSEPIPLVPNGFTHQGDPLSPIQRLSSRLMATLLLFPTLAVGLVIWQRLRQGNPDCRLVVAAACTLMIHAHLLMVGAFGVMATRYAVAMAPLLAVSGILLVSFAIERSNSIMVGGSSSRSGESKRSVQ